MVKTTSLVGQSRSARAHCYYRLRGPDLRSESQAQRNTDRKQHNADLYNPQRIDDGRQINKSNRRKKNRLNEKPCSRTQKQPV
jgi:hypothetical protein